MGSAENACSLKSSASNIPPRLVRTAFVSAPPPLSPDLDAAARQAFAYLSATDPLPAARVDAVMGFGTFDLSLAAFCGDVWRRGLAPRIVFTGGFGAGTADLGQPEADAWCEELRRTHPAIPASQIIVENRSTNTTENIEFTAALLERDYPDLAFGRGLRTAIVVAAPARLRRVKLALLEKQPSVRVTCALPAADFDREYALHERKGIPFLPHLLGELDRIVSYAERGWIASEPLPPEIAAAHAVLQRARA